MGHITQDHSNPFEEVKQNRSVTFITFVWEEG